MNWKKAFKRAAIVMGAVLALFVALFIAAGEGFVLVLSTDLDARFLAGYQPHPKPLTKILWISFGTNGSGGLIGRCPNGREKELYYLPSQPLYPVGKIC